MNVPIFITGNQNKADYLAKHLGISLAHHKLDLDEIQSASVQEVAEHKVRQAYSLLKRPVLVEDVSLGFTALGGMPGPFVKFFVTQPDGLEKLCRMLDGFPDRTATGSAVFAYYDGDRLELLTGSLHGTIAEHPCGSAGFGWDAIFCPDGYGGKTRAELDPNDHAKVYTTIKPFTALRELLTSLR